MKSVRVEVFTPGDNPTYDGTTDSQRSNCSITPAAEQIADASHKYEYVSSKSTPGDSAIYDGTTDSQRVNIMPATEQIADDSHKYEYVSSTPGVSCAGGGVYAYAYAAAKQPVTVASVHYEMMSSTQGHGQKEIKVETQNSNIHSCQ